MSEKRTCTGCGAEIQSGTYCTGCAAERLAEALRKAQEAERKKGKNGA